MMPVLVLAALLTSPAEAGEAEGRAIYVAKCQACHGPNGEGDGPAARALPKKPADMTTAAFWDKMTDARLETIITSGKPGTAMRAFPMGPDQLADLLSYLRSLKPAD